MEDTIEFNHVVIGRLANSWSKIENLTCCSLGNSDFVPESRVFLAIELRRNTDAICFRSQPRNVALDRETYMSRGREVDR